MVDALLGIHRPTFTSPYVCLHRHIPASLPSSSSFLHTSHSSFTPLQTTATISTTSQIKLPSSSPTSLTLLLRTLQLLSSPTDTNMPVEQFPRRCSTSSLIRTESKAGHGATSSSSKRISRSYFRKISIRTYSSGLQLMNFNALTYQRLWVEDRTLRLTASQIAAHKRTAQIIWSLSLLLILGGTIQSLSATFEHAGLYSLLISPRISQSIKCTRMDS
jgi:hypothetical protein